jgi:hypothetical protein
MLGVQPRPLADQERSRPDAHPPAPVPDAGHQVAQRPEPPGQDQPITDLGLVAVVQLDHVDRQAEFVDGVEVLEHVLLGHLGEVVVPGAPDRRRRPDGPHLQRGGIPVGPSAQGAEDAAWAIVDHLLGSTIRSDDNGMALDPSADRGDRIRTRVSGEHVHRPTGTLLHGERALALKRSLWCRAVRTVVHHPNVLASGTVRPVMQGVGGGRAPRLPAMLVDQRSSRIADDLAEVGEGLAHVRCEVLHGRSSSMSAWWS